MYIYFDNQGKQKAVIPHGEVPREGSDLNIYVCLPYDFWTSKNKTDGNFSKTLELKYPDKTLSVAMFPNSNLGEEHKFDGEEFSFFKMYACEPTYDFMEGGSYLRYQWKLSGEEVKAGKITAIIKFSSSSETLINGTVQFFVEKTYSESKRIIEEQVGIKYDDIISEIGKVQQSKVDKTAQIAGIEIQDGITKDELNQALASGFEQSYRKEIVLRGRTFCYEELGVVASFGGTLPKEFFKEANYSLRFIYTHSIDDTDLDYKVYVSVDIPNIIGKNFTLKAGVNEDCTLGALLSGFTPIGNNTWEMTATYNGEYLVLDEVGVSQNYQVLTGEKIYKLNQEKRLPYGSYVLCSKDYNPNNPSEEWSLSATNKSQWLRKDRLYEVKPSGIVNAGIMVKTTPNESNKLSSVIFALSDSGEVTTFPHTSNPSILSRSGISVPVRVDDNLWTKDYPDGTDFSKIADNEHLVMPKKYIDKKVPLNSTEDVNINIASGKKMSINGDFEIAGNLNVTGKTTTIDAENLSIKDSLLELAKGNTEALLTPAGFFVTNCDGNGNNYGIVVDKNGKFYYGKIVLNEDKTFSNNSELKELVFQEYDESDNDQVYVKTASGEKDLYNISKSAEEDTIAMRGTDGALNAGNAFSPGTPNDYYTSLYEGRVDNDGKSLYQSADVKPKVVTFDTLEAWFQDKYARAGKIDSSNGVDIANVDNGAIDYGTASFITPEYLNYAVKKALCGTKRMGTETGFYENTSFTDLEKSKACEILGALRTTAALTQSQVAEMIANMLSGYANKKTANTFSEQQVFNEGAVFNGDIIQNGKIYSTHTENLYTKKDFVTLRDGSTAALGNKEAGIIALNYVKENDEFKNGGLVYDGNGFARVGDIKFVYTALAEKPAYANAEGYYYYNNGTATEIKLSEVTSAQYENIVAVYEQVIDASEAQAIATRADDDELTDKHILIWDATNKKLIDGGRGVGFPIVYTTGDDESAETTFITGATKDGQNSVQVSPKQFFVGDTSIGYEAKLQADRLSFHSMESNTTVDLIASEPSGNIYVYLPQKGGTLATKEDLQVFIDLDLITG